MSESSQPAPVPSGVRRETRRVLDAARSVHLDRAAVARVAAEFAGGACQVPAWDTRYHFADGTPRTANYVLLLDTLNFCFWGEPRWRIAYRGETLDGYWALAAALKRAVEAGGPVLEAAYWAELTRAELARLLAGEHEIPLLDERVAAVREAGAWLTTRYQGQFVNAAEAAGFDAAALANLLARDLTSFADIAEYDGRPVPLLKRAQICASDLNGAAAGAAWGALHAVDQLTAFADYKLPQILRSLGIMVYEPALAARIDRREELAAGSPEEVEIRAATVQAVEELVGAVARLGRAVPPYGVDWYLWAAAQGGPHTALPYHRTRTIFY